jgi:hypothetical protein
MANNLEREFCSYEQALALKELGFDEQCFGGYAKDDKTLYIGYDAESGEHFFRDFYIPAPLKQQVLRWFRENGYMFDICSDFEDGLYYFGICYKHKFLFETDYEYKIYEEAENACIDKLILICKQQDNATIHR